jgi:hypothetical protein
MIDRSLFVGQPIPSGNRWTANPYRNSVKAEPRTNSLASVYDTGDQPNRQQYNQAMASMNAQGEPNIYMEGVRTVGKAIVEKGVKEVSNKAANAIREGGKGKGKSGPSRRNSGGNRSGIYNPSGTYTPRLSTPLPVKAYSLESMFPEVDKCSPLHVNFVNLSIPTGVTNEVFMYFEDVITQLMQTKIQGNISWSLDMNVFTKENLTTYLNDIMYGLSLFCYYNSIITYSQDANNQNAGMRYLRSLMTQDIISETIKLGEVLSTKPIPPNLYDFVRYFYNTYHQGNSARTSLCKFVPHEMKDNPVNITEITGAIDTLSNNNTLRKVSNVLHKALGNWIKPNLADYQAGGVFDPTWLTVWANAPFIVREGGVSYTWPRTTSDGGWTYMSYVNYDTIDGSTLSLTTALNTDTNKLVPNFVTVTGDNATRYSYYTDGTTAKFYPSYNDEFLSRVRGETYTSLDVTAASVQTPIHLPGTEIVFNVSARLTTDITKQTLLWLMSLDTVLKQKRDFSSDKRR